jgi:hypothetical protein
MQNPIWWSFSPRNFLIAALNLWVEVCLKDSKQRVTFWQQAAWNVNDKSGSHESGWSIPSE